MPKTVTPIRTASKDLSKPRHEKIVSHLRLALFLASDLEGKTLDEMEEEICVGRRTVQRMKAALSEIFDIERLEEERQPRFRIRHGIGNMLSTPTADEISELDLATKRLRRSGSRERARTLEALRWKIEIALRQRARVRLAPDVEALSNAQLPLAFAGPSIRFDAAILETARQSLKANCLLEFDYTTGSGKCARRQVAPRGLLLGRITYLVGALHDWGQPALWRLDRMDKVSVSEQPAWVDTAFDLEAYAARSFGTFQEKPEMIILIFDKVVSDEIRTYQFHPTQIVETLNDERIQVSFVSGGFRELALALFEWAGSVQIEKPEQLQQEFRNIAEMALE